MTFTLLIGTFAFLMIDTVIEPASNGGACGTANNEFWCGNAYYCTAPDSVLIFGKELFRSNCASCHAGDMKSPLTGPPLVEALEAWEDYPREELYNFIRNSQANITVGHPRAIEVWAEWGPTIMPLFESFTDENMEAILSYVACVGMYDETRRVADSSE